MPICKQSTELSAFSLPFHSPQTFIFWAFIFDRCLTVSNTRNRSITFYLPSCASLWMSVSHFLCVTSTHFMTMILIWWRQWKYSDRAMSKCTRTNLTVCHQGVLIVKGLSVVRASLKCEQVVSLRLGLTIFVPFCHWHMAPLQVVFTLHGPQVECKEGVSFRKKLLPVYGPRPDFNSKWKFLPKIRN